MYQLTVKGNSLEELKLNLNAISDELIANVVISGEAPELVEFTAPTVGALVASSVNVNPLSIAEEQLETAHSVYTDSEVDGEGFPWDARIHTSKKTKTKQNVWKNKRGVDQALVMQVKQEALLNAQQVSNVAAIAPAPITTPVAAPTLAPAVGPAVPVTPPVAPANIQQAPAPVPQPVLNTNGGHTLETFTANFPMIVSDLISKGKVTQDYINQLKTYFNVAEIWSITDVQKGEVFNSFAEFGFIQKVG